MDLMGAVVDDVTGAEAARRCPDPVVVRITTAARNQMLGFKDDAAAHEWMDALLSAATGDYVDRGGGGATDGSGAVAGATGLPGSATRGGKRHGAAVVSGAARPSVSAQMKPRSSAPATYCAGYMLKAGAFGTFPVATDYYHNRLMQRRAGGHSHSGTWCLTRWSACCVTTSTALATRPSRR